MIFDLHHILCTDERSLPTVMETELNWNHGARRGQLRGSVSKRSPFYTACYYYLLLNTRSFAHLLIKYKKVSHMWRIAQSPPRRL